mmetsp:Transcript_4397/g.4206  ORF Transcript_4397/g.4206 Transcript_4397/m.4206 type:complete len:377 (+) Transcript_4397:686-1816(+)
MVRCLLELGKKEQAEVLVRELLNLNPENSIYHEMLQRCRNPEEILGVYTELQGIFPRSTMMFRLELDLLDVAGFPAAFDRYMTKRVRKGIPSLFSDIKGLLKTPSKAEIIINIIKAHIETLTSSESFAVIDYNAWTHENGPKEQPQCLMWILLLYSKIQDFLKNYEEALNLIIQAIEHTPTVPDLYLTKGRILKHMGRLQEAINEIEEARNLDFSDRYLNNKSAKYLFRNNQPAQAEELLGLFSRERGELNTHDMQSTWVENEMAEAYFRLGEFAKAKAEFEWVDKQYSDMFDDQCDFHFYVMRKMNFNSYENFLKFTDILYKQKPFLRAGKGLIRCHLANQEVYSAKDAQKMARLLLSHHPEDAELHDLAQQLHL